MLSPMQRVMGEGWGEGDRPARNARCTLTGYPPGALSHPGRGKKDECDCI